MTLILTLVETAISLYILTIFVRFLLTWVPLRSGTFGYRAYSWLYDITEPYLRLFRSFLPLVRLGNAALDLSPVVGIAVLILVSRVVAAL